MEKEKKLAKNIVIFAIGSFSSKMLQFLLIPFYTRVLTNSEYGTIDILQSIATLLIPIISLTISEAVFRYAMEESTDKKEILSIGILSSFVNILIMSLIAIVIYRFTKYEYILILVLYISTNIVRTILSQFTRAIGKVAIYTFDNVLNVFVTICANILFLTLLHQGINGYLLGYVVGNSISIVLLLISVKLYKYIRIKKFNFTTFKTMLKFSIPLIPNSICWWITNFTDRIMITSSYGTGINGIYAVSHKIPTIITIVVEVFFQAWQISANKEFESKDISKFYSQVFKYLFSFVFIICAILMSCCKIITKIVVGSEFIEAWYYMPTLLLGTAFFSLSQYLGSIYTASKNTKMAFVTNMTAAVLNIVLNVILLKYVGPIGAAIATTICYIILWIYRTINTRKVIKIEYEINKMLPTMILLLINTIVITLELKWWYIYTNIILLFIIGINFKNIIVFLNSVIKMVKEKIQQLKGKVKE